MSLSRSTYYYKPQGKSLQNLQLMRRMDEQFLETPYYGSRQMVYHLRRQGYRGGPLMAKMGLAAIDPKPRTSKPNVGHQVYPYLLRDLEVNRPDQVWCADLTYISMRRGFLCLVAIMDWYSRMVLPWRRSNTLEPDFCGEALQQALLIYNNNKLEIFNIDQGSRFTSTEFTAILKNAWVRISMDGKDRWMGNVFIERLWRSLKYGCVYLNAFETGTDAQLGIGQWIGRYNYQRPHSTHQGATPEEVYTGLDENAERDLAHGLAPSHYFPDWRQQELRSPS